MDDKYAEIRAAIDANDITESSWLDRESVRALLAERDALREAAEAAIAYDAAIEQSANDPAAMSSFCTATGDNLDALYEDWITKARAALTQQEQGK